MEIILRVNDFMELCPLKEVMDFHHLAVLNLYSILLSFHHSPTPMYAGGYYLNEISLCPLNQIIVYIVMIIPCPYNPWRTLEVLLVGTVSNT